MAKSIFPKIPLNQAPDLTMADITKKLFDNGFLSDLKFTFKDETIHSHSFELKKRSSVYEQKFPTVINTLYPAFYEVIRFVYTDECTVLPHERIPMLKIAIKYKIPCLETRLINGVTNCAALDLFEYAQLGNYNLISTMMREWIQNELHAHIDCIKLNTLHPTLLEEILKLDYLQNFTEDQLFSLLLRWINHQCQLHQIASGLRSERFEKFFRLIRFPTMTIEQFTTCVNQDIDLFKKIDILNICRQISLGALCTDNCVWNRTKRLNSVGDHYRQIAVANHWETQFRVLNKILLCGLRFGFCDLQSNFIIRIIGQDVQRSSETLTFKFDKAICIDSIMMVNLGDAIILKPDIDYTIIIRTTDGLIDVPNTRDARRPIIQDEFINLEQKQIIRKMNNGNLLEIVYKEVN